MLQLIPDFGHLDLWQDSAGQVGHEQTEWGHGGRVRDDERTLCQVAIGRFYSATFEW